METPMPNSAWQRVDAQDFTDGSLVKNLPAMQEMQELRVTSLSWEGPLEEEMETQSSILAWKIPWTEEPVGYNPWGCKESEATEHQIG